MVVEKSLLDRLEYNLGKSKLMDVKKYIKDKKVDIYKIEFQDKYNFYLAAKVADDVENEIYNVEIVLQNGYISSNQCQCYDHTFTWNKCKHVVATILEFGTNPKYNAKKLREEYELMKKYAASLELIKEFNDIQEEADKLDVLQDNVLDGSVRIIPSVKQDKYSNALNLSFQIGVKQLYKIKDLVEFSNCLSTGSSYRYGAKLEFSHSIEKFDEEAKKIIPYILKYAQVIRYANDNIHLRNRNGSSYYKSLSLYDIVFEKEALDEFFEIYLNENVSIEIASDKKSYTFVDVEPDFKFEIEKINKDEYKLKSKSKLKYMYIRTPNYVYFLIDSKMHRCSNEFKKTTLNVLSVFRRNKTDEIIIKKEDIPLIFSLVIPKVKEKIILKDLEEEEKKYTPKELGVKVFLDFDDFGNIISTVKYCYDEDEYEAFLENEKIETTRNKKSENKAKQIFENTGFEIKDKHMILKDEEKIYNFLSNDINKYMEKFEVMATEKFKTKQIRQPKIGTLGVKVENNLLKVDLENLDFDKSELKHVMQKYNLKKKYHRLKDGSFLDLQDNEDIDFINSFTEGMDVDYKDISKGNVRVPVYRTAYLEKLLDNVKNTEIIKNDEYKEIINKIEDKEDNENILIPKKFNKTLRTYQKTGYKWLKVLDEYRFGGILADDMGLGKTLQLIVIINSYIESTKSKDRIPSLVVCPSSLSINWKNEVKKFSPNIKVLVVSGKAEDRKEQIQDLNKYDLIITSYDLLKRDIDTYNELKYTFKYVIADEAQYIKNSNTKNATAIKSINANTRFALTGTPIENSLSELWSIFDYIMPGYLFSYSKFKKNFETPIVKENDEKALKRLKMLIEPFVLRRLKKDVLTELPDKTISILNNEMVEEQNKIYLSHLMNAKKEMQEEINTNGFEKSQIKILALLTRLRQICCHPSLFIDNYKGESSKLNQCIEIIKDGTQSGHKILLFSQFTSMFEIIEKELNKEEIKYFKLTGQTKVDSRIKLVEEFNENKEIQVFLISLKAGGTGLNLTGADMVIHYDPWWNLSAENQATDRAYRIGQKNNVQVYKLITQNSIEEKINELQEKKAKLTENMLSTEETFINKLSKEDIMSLFE